VNIKKAGKNFLEKHQLIFSIYRIFQNRNNPEYLNAISLSDVDLDIKFANKKIHFDDNDNYYVIEGFSIGFMAMLRRCIDFFLVADIIGFKPYVWLNKTLYNVKGGYEGTDNVFDYYFIQDCPLTIGEIREKRNYVSSSLSHILAIQNSMDISKEGRAGYIVSEGYLHILGKTMKRHVNLKSELWDQFESDYRQIGISENTLGVHYRGTTFFYKREGHPVPLYPKDYFEYIDFALKNGYKNVFLATDDARALANFQKRYKSKIIYFRDVVRSETNQDFILDERIRENDGFLLGREVLRDMYALSMCKGLIAGLSQVSFMARIAKYSMDDKYDYIHIIDKGVNEFSFKSKVDMFKESFSVRKAYKRLGTDKKANFLS